MKKKIKENIEDATPIVATIIDAFTVLPVASTVANLVNYSKKTKEDFQRKKLETFLSETSSITVGEQEEFIKSLERDPEEFIKRTLLVIDSLNEEGKELIIAKLFKATIQKNLSIDYFQRLCIMIDQTYLSDLQFLYYWSIFKDTTGKEKRSEQLFKIYESLKKELAEIHRLKNLANTGLVAEYATMPENQLGGKGEIEMNYLISPLTKKLLEIAF